MLAVVSPLQELPTESQCAAWRVLRLLCGLEYLHHLTELSEEFIEFIVHTGPHGNTRLHIYVGVYIYKMTMCHIVPEMQICLCRSGLFRKL